MRYNTYIVFKLFVYDHWFCTTANEKKKKKKKKKTDTFIHGGKISIDLTYILTLIITNVFDIL